MTRVVIVDYGSGNIKSVANAISRNGFQVSIDIDGSLIHSADRLVVPGVAAFGTSVKSLKKRHQYEEIVTFNSLMRPILGFCLGAQLFGLSSEENPGTQGFGFVPASVVKIEGDKCRVPNQGWNRVKFDEKSSVAHEIDNKYFYFCHSYKIKPHQKLDEEAYTDINGELILAHYRHQNITGIQFHPEKSSEQGLSLLTMALNNPEGSSI